MNQAQFVQVPCVKCGTVVWIAPAAGVGYCPSCHTPNQLPAGGAVAGAPQGVPGMGMPGAMPGAPGMPGAPMPGAPMPGAPMPGAPMPGAPMGMGGPPGAPPGAMPGAPGMPGGYGAPAPFRGVPAGGGFSKVKTIGGAILAAVVAIGVGGAKLFLRNLGKDPGKESLSSLGITTKKGDPDKMIAAALAYAKKWKSDAVFRSITISALAADGTIDLTDKNVVVEYFSPSGVSSPLKTTRDDSIKKYNFMGENMTWDTKMIWGPTKQLTPAPPGTPIPGCTAKMLAAAAVKAGALKQGATVQATLDPNFSMSWIVQAPSGPMHFDAATCTQRKD